MGENADGIKFVSPSGFEAMTVEALRELADRQATTIAELQRRLDDQQQQLARLAMQMRTLADADKLPPAGSALAAAGDKP